MPRTALLALAKRQADTYFDDVPLTLSDEMIDLASHIIERK